MSDPLARLRRFLRELKRRNVYRVAVTYAVVAFVVWQVADHLFPALGFPAWTTDFVVILTLLGLPIALVVAWAFEMTPEGVRRTPEVGAAEGGAPEGGLSPDAPAERAPAPGAASDGSQARLAVKALVGLGVVAAAVAGGWYLVGGGGGSPEITEQTVAVLPFEVSGSGAETWRDGMVTYLTPGLDGVAGLRAIPDRTVFAAWEKRGDPTGGASADEALALAREVGARYAVVGSAGGLGAEVRFAVEVYGSESGERLGHVEVRGSPDSVPSLADSLTRRVVGVLAKEAGEELRSADLASVTTQSLPALKSYLAGERHNRNGQYRNAIEDYEDAIRADSGFALPYARLASLGLWHQDVGGQSMQRANELSDQLPERDRRRLRALYLGQVRHRTLAAADTLRRLTAAYPDDPSVWETLGELIFHSRIPRGWPEVERAHERAVELDPGNVSYYAHYVEPAFIYRHDSAMAASRVEQVPNERWRELYRLGLAVVFGDSAGRQRALSRYDTVSIPQPWLATSGLWAPQDGELLATVLRRLLEREDLGRVPYAFDLVLTDVRRGQMERALAEGRRWGVDTGDMGCLLAFSRAVGYPVSDSVAARYFVPENLPSDPAPRLVCGGLYLVESGHGDELDAWISRIRATGDATGPRGVTPGQRQAVIAELRGYRAWKRGDLGEAARHWGRSNEGFHWGAILRGDLYRELGQLERADGWYLAAWSWPLAQQRLGRLYEEMGRPEEAAAAYRRFIAGWEDADEALQPRVERARKRLRELTGADSDD